MLGVDFAACNRKAEKSRARAGPGVPVGAVQDVQEGGVEELLGFRNENRPDLSFELGNFLARGDPHNSPVYREIRMHSDVPKTDDAAPRNFGVASLELGRDTCRRLTDHRQFVKDGAAEEIITSEGLASSVF